MKPEAGDPGLSAAEVQELRRKHGINAVKEEKHQPWREFLRRFWAPIPWLLEASVFLQLCLGERLEAGVIGGLLVMNAVLSYVQEGKARKALALLRRQLQVKAHVRRDSRWMDLPAEELVPGDVIHLRQGAIVPADVLLTLGTLQLDQSALTGESDTVAVEAGGTAFAGAMVRRGEADGRVTAIGTSTFFGKTAELVRTAHTVNRQEVEITGIVRNLLVVNAGMVMLVLAYAHWHGMTIAYIVPLLLTILLASIPVALPATFTLAAALGSVELSTNGVLITRLSALHDIASMTVLCSDKTGTLTKNQASVKTVLPAEIGQEKALVRAAALASDPSGMDPVEGAILALAAPEAASGTGLTRTQFKPFDPATKCSEAAYQTSAGETRAYLKGAPAVVSARAGIVEAAWKGPAEGIIAKGQRVLGVAQGDGTRWQWLGLLGMEDAVREDSRQVVETIQNAGVRVVMITGDNALTARSVANQTGIPPTLCPKLSGLDWEKAASSYQVFAEVLPEDKYKLVRAFQRKGAVVGMSGDGVNDAPALRQAEAGIAVANATDVAKAAAAMVLTQPGLGGVSAAITTSRCVFQRIMTYTLNTLTKKMEMMALLVVGFLLTGHKPLTPMLMVLVLFLNDFLTMAISTDSMEVSPMPNEWHSRKILGAGVALALGRLIFSLGIFMWGHYLLKLDMLHLQALTFFTTIITSQAGVYLLRERLHCWHSMPGRFMLWSSILGLGFTTLICWQGWLVTALPCRFLAWVALAALAYFILLDFFKVALFAKLRLR